MNELGLPKANVPITPGYASTLDWYKFFVRLVQKVENMGVVRQQLYQDVLDGDVFVHSGKQTMAAGTTYDHLIVTPAASVTTVQFVDFQLAASAGPMDIYVYEGATVTTTGSAIPAYNQNRVIGDSASTGFYGAPSVSSAGTEILYNLLPGANNNGQYLAGVDQAYMVLKPSTNYLFRAVNNAATSATAAFTIRIVEGPLPN